MCRILDAKYEKADLKKVMTEKFQRLIPREREIILNILQKFEDFFNENLGTWNTTLVDLELNDDAMPVCSQPYPVPRVHEEIFRKEVERLLILGFLKESNDS